MIGEDITFDKVQEFVEIGKKKVAWYEYYLFKDKEQYEEWKTWAIREMARLGINERFDKVDLIYGLNYKPTKEKRGQLDLF